MINVLFRITTALLVWCYLIHGTETGEITECCVGEALGCAEQKLTCSGVLVLSITNVTFWCKQKCNHFNRGNCYNKTCCKHCRGQYCSCFSSYNLTLGSKEWENGCSYITIKYECNISTSSSTPTDSTSSTTSETISHTTGSTSSTPSEATSHNSGSTSSEERQASTTQTSNANSSASTSNNPSSSVTIIPNLSTQNHDLTSQPNDPMPNQISTHNQETIEITACCIATLGCAKQNLSCTGGQVLSITNVTFDYRQACCFRCDTHCYNKTCCKQHKTLQTLLAKIQQICNGTPICILANEYSYIKIKYECNTITSSSTPSETTSHTGSTSSTPYETASDTGSTSPTHSKTASHTGSTSSTRSETTSHPTGSTSSTPSETTSHPTGSTSSARSETTSHPTGSTSSAPSETTSHPTDSTSSTTFETISHSTGSTSSTPSEATSHTSGSTSYEERQASTTQTSNANSSGSTSNNPSSSVTITPNLSTQNHDLSSQPNDPMPNQISTHDQNVGGIVGGIVGVLVVGVIVGVCVFLIKRRQRIDPISPNNVHIESTVDTEVTTTLPAPISPVYFELESYNNTSSTTTQLTSSDNYDVIVAKPSRRNDNYDHIGVDVLTTDGDYNYLKGINSDKTTAAPDCNYNHVGLFTTEEDNYHHLGGKQSHFISEDTYSLESDDYHHIGESHGHSDTGLDGGDYNYIGCGQELPSMVDIIHYSVEDYSAIPDADAKGSGDISPFPDADTAGGIYSLAKRI